MKITPKAVAIMSSVAVVVAIGLFYFSSTRDTEEVLSWMNSNWLYRRSISVANPGSTLTNEDVLIVYDTATLITAGKLQSDCDDLRFVDSDDSTALIYWVEGGCNTSTTHIWVRIPSLPSGGKTIYMYYGNSSGTNAEETWIGKFYLMKNTSCDSGWTTESNTGGDFYQRFPYPAETFGTTGGSSSHNHGIYNLTTSTSSSGTSVTINSGTASISIGHNHSVNAIVADNSSVLPPYLDMIFCSNTDLIVKQNTLVLFNSSVPSGFTRFSALDDKFPRGNTTYGGTSTQSTHTHPVGAITTTSPSSTGISLSGSTSMPSASHTHTSVSTNTNSATQLPTYITVVYGQANSDIMAPIGGIVTSSNIPPLGWNRYSSLDGYFPYGSSSYGTTGGSTTHTHSIPEISFPATSNTVSVSTSAPTTSLPNSTHTHTTSSTTSSSYSNIPPNIQTLFIQKKSSQSATVNNEENVNYSPNQPSVPYTENSANNPKVTDTTPEFSAVFSDSNPSDTGNYYEIEVNTASNFSGTVMWDSGQTSITAITNGSRSSDISYAGTTLTTNGSTYYWRIRFWDNSGSVSSWSNTNFFTMSGAPNPPSDLYTESSTNPTSVTDITPEFSAIFIDDNGDSSAYYEIEINTLSNFSGTVMWDTGQLSITISNNSRSSDISYAGSTLTLDSTTYYWRIRFWDTDSNVSDWSSTASFTMGTNMTPYLPSSLYTEGSTNTLKVTDTTPEFSAVFSDSNPSDTGNYYEIEVNTASNFSGTVMWDSGQTSITAITNGSRSSDISYAGTTLTTNGSTYYWRIRFWDNSGGVSSWSNTNFFTMSGPPSAPSDTKVDSMTNPIEIQSLTPSFSALHTDPNSDNAVYYEIEVNTLSNFSGTVMWDTTKSAMTSTPSNQYSPDITYAGTTLTGSSSTIYYWRVRFWDTDDNVSEWSTTASFTDFVEEDEYIQMEGVLLQGVKINPINSAPSDPTNLSFSVLCHPQQRYSSTFNDPNPSDTGNYYEIEVNTSSDFLGTVMNDTGQTSISPIANGSSSGNIVISNFSLQFGVTYYWRMRFWDNNGAIGSWANSSFNYPSKIFCP